MIEITPKEIENVGASRYLNEHRHKRLWWAVGVFLAAAIIVVVFSLVTKGKLDDFSRGVIEALVIIGGFGYYCKVLVMDAPKAGKKFREEWEKEKQR